MVGKAVIIICGAFKNHLGKVMCKGNGSLYHITLRNGLTMPYEKHEFSTYDGIRGSG